MLQKIVKTQKRKHFWNAKLNFQVEWIYFIVKYFYFSIIIDIYKLYVITRESRTFENKMEKGKKIRADPISWKSISRIVSIWFSKRWFETPLPKFESGLSYLIYRHHFMEYSQVLLFTEQLRQDDISFQKKSFLSARDSNSCGKFWKSTNFF